MTTNSTKKAPLARAAFVAVAATILLAAGCNTVKGVGKDIETAGDRTQKAINNE